MIKLNGTKLIELIEEVQRFRQQRLRTKLVKKFAIDILVCSPNIFFFPDINVKIYFKLCPQLPLNNNKFQLIFIIKNFPVLTNIRNSQCLTSTDVIRINIRTITEYMCNKEYRYFIKRCS